MSQESIIITTIMPALKIAQQATMENLQIILVCYAIQPALCALEQTPISAMDANLTLQTIYPSIITSKLEQPFAIQFAPMENMPLMGPSSANIVT